MMLWRVLDNILDKSLTAWEKLYGAEPSERSFSLTLCRYYRACLPEDRTTRSQSWWMNMTSRCCSAIGNEDLQKQFRDTLKPFYGALKTMDGCIKFALLTGVTKFGKVSVFSDLNNLKDIWMDERFVDICGITEKKTLQPVGGIASVGRKAEDEL